MILCFYEAVVQGVSVLAVPGVPRASGHSRPMQRAAAAPLWLLPACREAPVNAPLLKVVSVLPQKCDFWSLNLHSCLSQTGV